MVTRLVRCKRLLRMYLGEGVWRGKVREKRERERGEGKDATRTSIFNTVVNFSPTECHAASAPASAAAASSSA